jgi:hypothetical protein
MGPCGLILSRLRQVIRAHTMRGQVLLFDFIPSDDRARHEMRSGGQTLHLLRYNSDGFRFVLFISENLRRRLPQRSQVKS